VHIASTSVSDWIAGARVRTLPAAIVPVAVGTAVAIGESGAIWWRAAVAAVVSLALQLGTNYANDYSDGIRGTDDDRVGPVRLVASQRATPKAVKTAAFVCFGVAAVAGLTLAAVTSWWLIAVGAAAIAAGWFYTGGSRPYGYSGLGEVFVFVFFGLVATVGTAYIQTETISTLSVVASVPVGLLAVALLITNNLRDIPGDAVTGKRTLAVRLGDAATRRFYVVIVVLTFVVGVGSALSRPGAVLCLLAAPLAIAPVRTVLGGAKGRELIAVLAATAKVQLVFGVAYAIGLSF
jgi:1,4-dihydroxy-2-naphthoate polyprenyltransferase